MSKSYKFVNNHFESFKKGLKDEKTKNIYELKRQQLKKLKQINNEIKRLKNSYKEGKIFKYTLDKRIICLKFWRKKHVEMLNKIKEHWKK